MAARGDAVASSDLFSVEGRSVLVTGASGALGSTAARALAAAGARLTLAGANRAALEEIAAEVGHAAIVERRPETEADADAMVEAAVREHGRLDGVLVAS